MMKIWFICFGLLGLFQPLFSQTYEEWVKQERAQYDRLAKETNRGLEELQKDYDSFVKQLHQVVLSEQQLTNSMEEALLQRQFEVYYQP